MFALLVGDEKPLANSGLSQSVGAAPQAARADEQYPAGIRPQRKRASAAKARPSP